MITAPLAPIADRSAVQGNRCRGSRRNLPSARLSILLLSPCKFRNACRWFARRYLDHYRIAPAANACSNCTRVEQPGAVLTPAVDAQPPAAEWVARQITEAFPWNEAPRYMIRDRDGIYGAVVTRRLRAMGIRDKPTAPTCWPQSGI
jgi:hypothetical protein